ncbi:hypothetical protein BDZ89DRAFT_351280 [Hymenopellis radicata]|nr:hypothetical protein BDZ89DRAFT_351280 [Hymenopellis radicata]
MPLSRPNPYSHSSVSPLSAYPPSPRPPKFLPPSHYAAAGGFAFPQTKKAHSSSADSRDAYPISTETPDDVKSGGDKRFTFRSNASRNKRESQLVNLPMVETQLLPSLRDTIDRMTRPPSRASPSTLKVAQPRLEQSPSHADYSRSPRPRTPLTPKPSASHPPPEEPPSTPRTPKSVLKSALRAPTPKVSEPSSPSPAQRLAAVHSNPCAVFSVAKALLLLIPRPRSSKRAFPFANASAISY